MPRIYLLLFFLWMSLRTIDTGVSPALTRLIQERSADEIAALQSTEYEKANLSGAGLFLFSVRALLSSSSRSSSDKSGMIIRLTLSRPEHAAALAIDQNNLIGDATRN